MAVLEKERLMLVYQLYQPKTKAAQANGGAVRAIKKTAQTQRSALPSGVPRPPHSFAVGMGMSWCIASCALPISVAVARQYQSVFKEKPHQRQSIPSLSFIPQPRQS
jgi:hypothetical protein